MYLIQRQQDVIKQRDKTIKSLKAENNAVSVQMLQNKLFKCPPPFPYKMSSALVDDWLKEEHFNFKTFSGLIVDGTIIPV